MNISKFRAKYHDDTLLLDYFQKLLHYISEFRAKCHDDTLLLNDLLRRGLNIFSKLTAKFYNDT
jgi:hypothetical protein